MVSDEVRQHLSEKVEGTGRTLDWAIEQYEQALEDVEERVMEDISEEKKREYALGMVESEQIFRDRVGGGEEMELDILAIGQGGVMTEWGQQNDTVVYSYGLIYGPLGEDGEEKAGQAVFINKASSGPDLDDVRQKFHALNTMKAVYEVNESDDLDGVYVCWSNDATAPKEQELDSLPTDREEKLKTIRHFIDEASLATLENNLSAYDPDSDENYTRDFGADLKRINAKVVDRYVGERDDGSLWGRYTIMDESVTEDDIVGTDIVDDDQNIPGLTCWMGDPKFHGEFGRKSRLELYGTIEHDPDDGFEMNVVGVVPIIPMPVENDGEEQADANVNSTETQL